MKKYIVYLMLSFVWTACSKESGNGGETPVPDEVYVKVMTYNIYGARASASLEGVPADLQKIAAVINKEKPDLVCLQEVDVYTKRTGKDVHQAKELARLTGMNWFFARAINRDGGEYGDAVLSRYPILDSVRYAIPPNPDEGGEDRSVALITVEVSGKRFGFASTHLAHESDASRVYQAGKLKSIVEKIGGPLVLGGDFNSKPDSEAMGIIKKFMTLGCGANPAFTWPSDALRTTLDYVMYKPVNAFTVRNYVVVDEPEASDHCPVVCLLRVL